MKPPIMNTQSFRKTLLLTEVAAMALFASQSSQADTIYWDGASASWNTAGNWSTDSGVNIPNPVAFPGANDDAIFNITTVNDAQTVTLDASQLAKSMMFNNTGTTTLRGNVSATTARTLTIGTGGITVASTAGAVTISDGTNGAVNMVLAAASPQTWQNNSANALTFGGTVTLAANALTLQATSTGGINLNGIISSTTAGNAVNVNSSGAGVVTLGAANTFNGGLNIQRGTVKLGNATAAGVGLVTLGSVGNSATLDLNGASRTFNSLATAGTAANQTITNSAAGAAILNYTGATTSTFGGVIEDGSGGGTTALTLNNVAANLTLTGSNTFSGAVTITNGTLSVASIGNSGDTSNLGKNGTINITNNSSLVYTGTGETSAKVINLSGTTSGGKIDQSGTGLLKFTSNFGVNTNSKTLTLQGSTAGTGEISGVIPNNAHTVSLAKEGTGTWTLSGANTYIGATTVRGGTLILANQSAVQSSTLTMNGGAVVFDSSVVGNAFTAGGLAATSSGAGFDIALQNNAGSPAAIALTVGGNNAATTYAGVLSGAGALTKTGTQTLTLTGANTYSGTTTITSGTLQLGNGTIDGTIGNTANIQNNGVLNYNRIGSHSYSGQISGTGSVTKTGAGTQTLSGNNTYNGNTNLNAGTLNINSATALGTGTFVIGNGTTFDNTTGGALTLTNNNAITIANNLVNDVVFTFGGTNDLNLGTGAVSLGLPSITAPSTGIIQLNGTGRTLTFGGAVTSPARGVGATTMQVDGAGNTLVFGSLGLNERSTGSTNIWSGSANVTVNGGVFQNGTGSQSFAYAGTGTFTIGGISNYAGTTTVRSGKLSIGTNGAINSGGNVTIGVAATAAAAEFNYNSTTALTKTVSFAAGSTGGILSGTGTINSAVNVTSGNTLSIGNSVGQMNFGSTLTLAGTTIMEIDGNAGAGMTGGHDFANVTGALTYGGALTLDMGMVFSTGSYTWNLFDFASASGDFATITLEDQYSGSLTNGGGGVWGLTSGVNTWEFTQSTGVLGLTVVPEPSAAMLLGAFGTLALLRRRRA